MVTRNWTVGLEDGSHTVEVDHRYLTGKRAIRVDGKPLQRTARVSHALFDLGSTHPFMLGAHSCAVVIQTNGLTYLYDLLVDGRSQRTGKSVTPRRRVPQWAWGFIIACAAIPLVALGGAVPAALGIGGALGCRRIARDTADTMAMRVALCAVVTALCWCLFFLFLLIARGLV